MALYDPSVLLPEPEVPGEEPTAEPLYIASLLPSERIRNRLFWRDDMENYTTMKWSTVAAVMTYVNTIPAFEGDYVLQITHAATLSPTVWAMFGALEAGIHAVELRWFKESISAQGVRLHLTDPTTGRTYYGDILWQANAWRYINGTTGALTLVPNGAEIIDDDTWNYLRVTMDFSNNIYKRIQTNYLDIDLTALALGLRNQTPAWGTGRFVITLLGTTFALNDPIYFDDVRLYLGVE